MTFEVILVTYGFVSTRKAKRGSPKKEWCPLWFPLKAIQQGYPQQKYVRPQKAGTSSPKKPGRPGNCRQGGLQRGPGAHEPAQRPGVGAGRAGSGCLSRPNASSETRACGVCPCWACLCHAFGQQTQAGSCVWIGFGLMCVYIGTWQCVSLSQF